MARKKADEGRNGTVSLVVDDTPDGEQEVILAEDPTSLEEAVQVEKYIKRSSLVTLTDHFEWLQNGRVGCDIRLAHLHLRQRTDPDTQEMRDMLKPLERRLKDKLSEAVVSHPTYDWWGRIEGISFLTMARILGAIDGFGRFYDVGDPMIPHNLIEPNRKPVTVQMFDEDGKPTAQKKVFWVEGIERFTTPGKLKKFAGLVPGQKLEEGKRAGYSTRLKGIMYRLATFSLLMKKKNYFNFFCEFRKEKLAKLISEGVKILPTPKGKWCLTCEEEKTVKSAKFCPDCDSPLQAKSEPDGVMYKIHFFLLCVNRVESLFLQHLWQVYRTAVGLPVVDPYPIAILGHQGYIDAWQMATLKEPQEPKFSYTKKTKGGAVTEQRIIEDIV